jgi:hypothetical protein
MKKIIILFLLGAVIIGASMGLYFYQKPVASLESQTPTGTFSSTELFEIFNTDEQAANAKYTGQVVEVSGEVVEIMENSDASTTLVLSSDDPIFGVKCRIDPEFNKKSLPETGTEVRVKGLCTGVNADVELNQCIIL